MRRYALHALLAFNAALILVLLVLWVTQSGEFRNTRWTPPEPHKTDLASLVPPLPGVGTADTTRFIAMLDRPLFSITRRPPPPPPPPKPPEVVVVDNLSTARLSGVFAGDGASGIILLIAGKNVRAKLNDTVDGWTLSNIGGRAVTFTKGDQTRVLQLPKAAVTTYSGMPAMQAPSDAAVNPSNPAAQGQAAAAAGAAAPARPSPSFGGRSR